MKKLQNFSAGLFIICVIILSAISILGVWDVFGTDVITKSFETLGLLAGVAVIVVIAGHFMDAKHDMAVPQVAGTSTTVPVAEIAPEPNPLFTQIRRATIAVLVGAVALLALMGVLSIWEVVNKDVLEKAVSSITILGFSSVVIVGTCLEREQHKFLKQRMSGGMIVLVLILGWIFFRFLFNW